MTTTPDRILSNFDENAHHIAKRQYLQAGDGDLGGMFRRIADWVAGAEAPEARLGWAQRYYDLMAEKKFCPGGRVLAGAGTQHGNVLNCLQGDTLVETRQGQARIADLSGEVEVLSQGGLYRTARFRSYGTQDLYRVLFENGETVEATAGHEWPVGKRGKSGQYRKVTTLDLVGQFVPVLPTGRRPARDEDFEAGVRHGVTYGDGSKNTNGHTYHVQLFGAKRPLAQHFGEFRVHDAVYAGREVTVAQGMRGELKALPDELSSDAYWYGFFCGLLATDGGVDDRGSAAIYQSDADELARLARQLVRFGVKAASVKLFRQADAGYGGKPGYALRLIKQTLLPEDFLREDQRERFGRSLGGRALPRNARLRVLSVEPTGRREEVFCCEEPQTRTFVIQGGLLTGNCFVQGATEHAPESFDGVMEVAKKLALVTKVGGGNGVNLDVYTPRAVSSRPDAGVRGWAYMSAGHPDVTDFIEGLMRPPTQPDGEKQPVAVRNWTRVVYGHAIPPELVASARQNGVQIVRALPQGVQPVPDDMGGIIDAARAVAESAKVGVEPRIDLSEMRPEGAPIQGSGGTSSGPVSFLMEIFDNFLEWANRGGETSGPINTLRFVYAPVLRVVRQGGCLHPDTLVTTSRGTLRLRELADPFTYGWQDHALEVATDEGWKHSPQTFNNGVADTLKVTLESGLTLQGTPNHKLKVLRESGEREWVRFDELRAGDWAIQVLDEHTGGSVTLAPLGEGDVHFNAKPITMPETLTEDLAFWLGYLWGDGFVSDGRVGFAVAHGSPMIEAAPRLFRELFGLEVGTEQKPDDASLVYVTKSSALVAWLSQNGLLKGKARDLELPRAVRQAARNVVAAFLRGLFEADGTVTAGYPMLTTASEQLAQDVLVMLGGLGIPAKLMRYNPLPGRYSKQEHYRVRVMTALGLERYLERVGMLEGSRFEVLRGVTPDTRRESSWPLPHAAALLGGALDALPAGRKGAPSPFTEARKTLSRYVRGERNLTATAYASLKENVQVAELIPDFEFGEYYVPVREIVPGGRILTLDICVDGNNTYLAGGVVTHNTRRGAGMATISIEHPDVLDFLTAKDLDREAAEGDISTFNISILVTEKFWQTLERDGLWHVDVQDVPGKYYLEPQSGLYDGRLPTLPDRAEDGARGVPLYKTAPQGRYNPADKRPGIPAKWLWDQIAQHAWATGEPGLIFVDRVNEYSALKNLGKRYEIRSTNPCVTGDTLVAVADGRGAVSFRELTEAGVDVPVYTQDDRGNVTVRWMRNPRVTGYDQPIYEVTFDDGLKVRVTGNHRFNLTDGTAREALALQPGDSVASLTRFHAKFDEVLPHMTKTRSQDYVWLTSGQGQPKGEHRLIAAFALGRALKTGEVVHHRDYDAQNNRPSNLEVMTVEAHDDLHRADMLGDDNPMRERWWGQLTDADKDAHRARLSAATSGERNGRYSGLTHAELEEAARELARALGRGFTNREWQTYAKERGLPQSFSEHRETELGSVNALSERVANDLGLPVLPRGVGQSRQAVHNFDLYQSALASGYVAVRHEGNFYPIVTRACEDCGTHYEQPWNRREVSYCRPCGLKRASAAGREGARAAMGRVSENTSERQVRAFNDLKFRLGRRPLKTEWEAHCREAGVPVRLHPGGLPTYAALTERASVANHRVMAVEYVGREDVYNGTVDEFHNYYIGHHAVSAKGEKPRFSYVNTRQCGEIPLTVGEPCDLGAINLAAYVKGSTFDYASFRADVRTCVRFLDDVLDVNVFALEDNRVASQDLRRLGLGVMGLADALIKMGLRYDSEAGRQAIYEIMSALREEAVAESERLGQERGVYPVYERNAKKIPHGPRRNVAVLTVAPTGTTSMLMGVSSGIEPIFSPFIWRKIGSEYRALLAPLFVELLNQYPAPAGLEKDGGWDWDKVTEAVSENHGSVVGLAFIPEALQQVFVCAHDIKPEDHVRMQGTVQRAFDDGGQHAANSLSKCIAAGTLIPTSAGLVAIEDFARTLEDDTFTPLDGTLTVDGHRITQHYRAGVKPATRITLDSGATLVGATASHRVLTPEGWRLMSELRAGDTVLGKFLASHGAGGLPIEWTDEYRTNALPVQTPKAMTPALARFLGMLAADGHTTESTGNVGLTCKDAEVETEFTRLCQEVFGLTPRRTVDQRNGVVCLSLTSRNLARYVEALIGKGAYHKHAPKQLLRGSAEEKQAFLEGLTLGGYVWEGGLCLYAGMSEQLAYHAAEMARSFGLPKVYQGRKWVEASGNTCHLVSVSNEMQEILKPVESRKKVVPTQSWYRVHVPAATIAATRLPTSHVGYTNFKSVRGRGALTCKNTSAEQIGWDTGVLAYRVTAVEDAGMVEMYDIEVEGSHAYVVNGMISHNTINLPNSATVGDVQDAYSEAYRTGCKGITVYRDGSRQFQVLSTSKKKEKKAEAEPAQAAAEVMGESAPEAPKVEPQPTPVPTAPARPAQPTTPVYERPARLSGITDMVKLTDPTSGHRRSFLVTVNHLNGKPIEVMVISGRAGDEANADSEALGRVVSIALQHGVPAQALIKTLRGINGGLYGSYNGRLVGSKADLIAVALETFAKDTEAAALPPLAGASVDLPPVAPAAASGVSVESMDGMSRESCPVCEEKAVIREEGCLKCQACGYSKCG
ncbi:hypothetical protein DAERI_050024 [Deinococcus aerius]|uniref:Ribonucleoside-diphosphate reductase n=1 Tax=Deinococcus aerius TaxID=200253 RepID=A0A2I9DXM6_9DEIO|nr:LAGLIDADG family homing endonuclease [Deinococcus aerius]GBF05515.1 hypothetical protein DAERI_050024 [Deinococcus aerius]